MSLTITSPTQGQILNGSINAAGAAVGREGEPGRATEITYSNFQLLFNGVRYTASDVVVNHHDFEYFWSLAAVINVAGSVTITIRATETEIKTTRDPESTPTITRRPVSASVVVQVDLPATITIIAPVGQPASIPLPETGLHLPVSVRAQDPVGIDKVEASVDTSQSYKLLIRDEVDASLWNNAPDNPLTIPGSPLPAGVRKLSVRAHDRAGNVSETSLDFIVVDNTAPAYVILGPNAGKKIPWSAPQTVIEVNGTATDMQSGVASVTCKLLNKTGSELSNQVKTFSPASPGLVSWNMTFPITSPGWYSFLCEFRDHAGQLSKQDIGNLEVAESFSPADINDLLGSRQYLEDLLKFFNDHFKRANGDDITADDLMQVFHQEFERLAKQTDAATAQRPVNQVRLCVEVLRKFLNDLTATDGLEPEYTLLAYETLLRQMGTSYEEMRLAHGAEPAQRRALAARLGINLNPQWSDYLDRLLLQPQEITEAKLESLFSLMDTTQDPFGSRASRQLFDWQAFQLHAMWVDQDRGLQEPIIDPDVIGKSDLAKIEPTDPAFALWNARSTQIKQHFQTVKTNRLNQSNALAGLKKIVDDALLGIINDPATPTNLVPCDDSVGNPLAPLDFLICIDALHKNGKDIQPVLGALHLDLSALRYLLRIHGLAKSVGGTVTEAEWESVYHILTRVWKASQRKSWRAAETGLAISPQFFKLYRDELPWLPSTGTVDGALLANGVDDPNWILTAAPGETPTGKVFVTQQQPGTWLANNDRSHWISPNKNASAVNAPGVYVYKTNFDLSGWDLATVQILATVAADDLITDVKLNGTSLKLTAVGFQAFTTLSLSGPLQDGENTVEFVVSNLSTSSTGLRVELSFATSPRRVQLPRWRRPEDARREWQSILRARIDQEAGLRQGFDSAIQATEEVALPVLRDSLIKVIGATKGMALNFAAEWLSERFFIETQGSGWRLTTRVLQAIETMQSLIFSLRTQRFAEDHPANRWSLPAASSQFDTQEEFDEEWKWAGNYETWRGAMLVFYYPENILLPSLRDASDITPPFKKLLQSLRAKSHISPVGARELAGEYLDEAREAAGTALPEAFILTDERTEAQLTQLSMDAEKALSSFSHNLSATLREIFYFVPMALALQLQRSGEYTAALDWFQTVYAYNLPRAQRKIYPGLKKEVNGVPILSRTEHWLRDFLNPHDLAEVRSSRSNPYTRFTLMSVARCFLEFGDAEFTNDTGDSLARARSLYLSARNLLGDPDFDQIQPESENETLLPNPVLGALRKRIENQLAKLHQGRNISGMKREIEIPTPPKTIVGLPTVGTGGQLVIPGLRPRQKPTPYRFSVLMERAKQLVGIAQQIEAAYLAALEKRDVENYNLKKAGFDLQLAEAGNKLQELRELEAINGETLAARQKSRATKQKETYGKWLGEGPSLSEKLIIENHKAASSAQQWSALFAAGITVSQAITTAATASAASAFAAAAGAATTAHLSLLKADNDVAAIQAQTAAQILSIEASQERRANDWQLGYDLADIDEQIATQQASIATDHRNIVVQEKTIAQAQTTEARAMADYLANKFTSAELYEWMSGVLGGVYSYFLQQATGVAMLAESQLTFERQEAPTSFIQNDYWERPSETGPGNAADKPKDRRGLTGSARLLQDIHQLDQYAFETNKRKLNLAHTISLAALDPFAFAVFRNTGVLNFNTPMRLFDEAFPGHYLRLIKRVRTSVVALIPPVLGIRATLMASGISRVIVGGDVFQETTIRRDPELVALSSPANATGVFELDAQTELLMPFESMGVSTGWEFSMPRASNPFDFGTIADVLITIEYTALSNDDYRRQVIQELDPLVSANKAYSIRNDFPDVWYDLRNEEGNTAQISFRSERTHFPPNLDDNITILELLFAVIPTDENTEITGDVTMTYTPDGPVSTQAVTGKAALTDLRVQTRLPAGRSAWGGVQGKRATGKWQFDLPADLITKLRNDAIDDVLVVATFAGAKPTWPT